MTKLQKGTHEEYRIDLFMPIMKSAEGKYLAVLSDDSFDRDDERIGKVCIEKFGEDENYLAALLNHDNDIMNLVAEWVNKRVVTIGNHTAFVAEPKFYLSNPKAKIIKGMLDDGAKPGISIGAIVKDYDEIDGKKVFTQLELLEASFVGIPSNRHGRAMAVAKSFNNKKSMEDNKMDKEFTKQDVDTAVEKKVGEVKTDLNKQLESEKSKSIELEKKLEEATKSIDEAKKQAETEKETASKKVTELEKALEAEKKTALEKQQFADNGGEEDGKGSEEDTNKAFSEGKLPYARG